MFDAVTTPDAYDQQFKAVIRAKTIHELCVSLRDGGTDSYPAYARLLNTFALHPGVKGYLSDLRVRILRFGVGELMGGLDPSEFVIWHAIVGRTLLCGKFAEVITEDHFLLGVPDKSGNALCLDNDGRPFFSGCQIRPTKFKAVRRDLLSKGVISRRKIERPGKTGILVFAPVPLWLIESEVAGRIVLDAQHLGMHDEAKQIAQRFRVSTRAWQCVARLSGPFRPLVTPERANALDVALHGTPMPIQDAA